MRLSGIPKCFIPARITHSFEEETAHFGENLSDEELVEEAGRRVHHLPLQNLLVHRHHVAAHRGLIDLAALVRGVTLAHRPIKASGDNISHAQFPVEEALSGITRPKCAVAIKCSDTGRKAQDRVEKFLSDGKKCFCLCGVHLSTITCFRGSAQWRATGQDGRANSPA
jgi:hypothetical protein